jgi:hypothetical protein
VLEIHVFNSHGNTRKDTEKSYKAQRDKENHLIMKAHDFLLSSQAAFACSGMTFLFFLQEFPLLLCRRQLFWV